MPTPGISHSEIRTPHSEAPLSVHPVPQSKIEIQNSKIISSSEETTGLPSPGSVKEGKSSPVPSINPPIQQYTNPSAAQPETEAATFQRLARLPLPEYDHVRRAEAKRLKALCERGEGVRGAQPPSESTI